MKYDRFQNAEPQPASEVGDCRACGGTIYGYEHILCKNCGADIHEGCEVICKCSRIGCRSCMILDEDTLDYYCDTASTGKLEDSECFQENK